MTDSRTQAARLVSLDEYLSGQKPLYKGAPYRDILPRLNSISSHLVVEDREGILEDCYGHQGLAEICEKLYRTALQRVSSKADPVIANAAFLESLLPEWETLRRHELEARENGSFDADPGASQIFAALHDALSVYLGLGGYREARPALLELMWQLARPLGHKADRIARRALGLSLLHDLDWPRCQPGQSYPDILLVADSLADDVLLRTGDNRRETHAQAMDDDRAGVRRVPPGPELDRLIRQSMAEPLGVPGAVVFPKSILTSIGKPDNQRDVKAILGDTLGRELPLVPVPADWDAWEQARLAKFPWAHRAIRAFRTAQAGRSHFGLAVICLHGSPGAGKSALARELAESCGLRFVRYQADSASENSYGGTSVRWQSGHLGIAEAAIASAKMASVCISHDEIEKAAGTRKSNGGALHDTLHGAWEPETARAWSSPFLLHPVDLSHVVYIATANEISTIPASLRDRMVLVEVPEPGPEHLGVLAPRVARELCRQRGLDEGWAAFDSVEWESLRANFRGGSIRTLQSLVEMVFRVRDEFPVDAGMLN